MNPNKIRVEALPGFMLVLKGFRLSRPGEPGAAVEYEGLMARMPLIEPGAWPCRISLVKVDYYYRYIILYYSI